MMDLRDHKPSEVEEMQTRISGEASVSDQSETNSNSQNSNVLNFCLFGTF
jgi:hypothetical protein